MTPVELQKQLAFNSDFDSPVDAAKAHRYVQIARQILGAGVAEFQHGGVRTRFDLSYIRDEMNRAIAFVKANDSNLAVDTNTFGSLENFRA